MLSVFLILALSLFISSADSMASEGDIAIGVNVMAGGRYDDLRMCVGSPAGVKGGPIADVMLYAKYGISDDWALGLNLPVFRPILFGLAFDMLQFEPEFTLDYRKNISDGLDFVVGPGLGVSLHYGPDYKTEKSAENPDSFWAAGPFISGLFGLGFGNNLERVVGVRAFYVPLLSEERPTGTVLGAVLEGQFGLYNSGR